MNVQIVWPDVLVCTREHVVVCTKLSTLVVDRIQILYNNNQNATDIIVHLDVLIFEGV